MTTSLKTLALAEPCRAKQVLNGRVVVDPADGRERFWLTNMNEQSGGELIAVDFARDAAEVYYWPAGQGSWCVLPLPGERLAISTYYDGKFLLFDLRKKEFTRVISFPGESYIWNMAIGADGRVYGGTYNGAKLGCFDPDTGAFEDCGTPVAGTGNLYLRTVVATLGGDIACTFGYVVPSLMIYRLATKTFAPILPEEPGFAGAPLVTVRGHLFVSDPKRGLRAFAGPGLTPVDRLPLPECPIADGWSGVANYSRDDRVFLSAGGKLWRWLPETGALDMIFDVNLRGGIIYDVSSEGRILGVRGQDYFVASPGDSDVRLRRIPAESRGRPSHFLVADDTGKLWGGPPFGQTVWSYELGTGEIQNTGAVVDSGGEVYGAVAVGGKLYTASYAGADFAVYDPAKPWDQWHGVNPHHIASIRDRSQCRPTGRMRRAPDGKLYSGWQAAYGRYGGALARLDPETEEVAVWEDPLGDEPIVALAVDDRYAYLGTNQSANGLPTREGDGQFGVWDLKAERVVFQQRMTGMKGVGSIGALVEPRFALFPKGDRLLVFDAEALVFREEVQVSVPGSPGWTEDVLLAPIELAEFAGYLLFARGTWLVLVHPELRVETRGPLEQPVGHMAFGSDHKLYYTSGPTLYRVEGL